MRTQIRTDLLKTFGEGRKGKGERKKVVYKGILFDDVYWGALWVHVRIDKERGLTVPAW